VNPALRLLMDSESGTAMTLGRTSLVTEAEAEGLSRMPVGMVVGGGEGRNSRDFPKIKADNAKSNDNDYGSPRYKN